MGDESPSGTGRLGRSVDAIEPPVSVRRRPSLVRRMAVGLAYAVLGLVLLAALLYAFGGMWLRTPEMRAAYQAQVDAGVAPAIDGRFVIPIPGCVCHSDDVVVQARHSVRRISECTRCHGSR